MNLKNKFILFLLQILTENILKVLFVALINGENKTMEKKIVFMLLIIILPLVSLPKSDTTMYFGINGKIENIEQQKIKKEIRFRSGKNVRVKTYKFVDENWVSVYTEKITIKNDSLFEISVRGNDFSGLVTRVFDNQDNGTYRFTDWQDNKKKRVGYTISKIPLIFHGEVTEYYSNGNIKSVSEYENNEMVSNKNWLENGEKYIDNIFYSVDMEPRYYPGMTVMHSHVLETFKNSNLDLTNLDGRIVVGFVVLENGMIDGVRIENGFGWQLNTVAVRAFKTLPGTWQPAKLDGKDVRYYQLFPINFIHYDYDFDSLDFKGGMLYWEIN